MELEQEQERELEQEREQELELEQERELELDREHKQERERFTMKQANKLITKNKGRTMKKLVETTDSNHLETYIGEVVTIFACRYIYSGKLVSIDETSICLEEAGIIYETGELTDKKWKDRQALPGNWCIAIQSIESFGLLK